MLFGDVNRDHLHLKLTSKCGSDVVGWGGGGGAPHFKVQ